jgi:hypothetical protein
MNMASHNKHKDQEIDSGGEILEIDHMRTPAKSKRENLGPIGHSCKNYMIQAKHRSSLESNFQSGFMG